MTSTTDTVIICANCGKGEERTEDLKSCTACKLVKYCNRDCQIAHRPQHKKACKKRAAELYYEMLFSEPPPREECPICMLPLPLDVDQIKFQPCCGKTICFGCIHAMTIEGIRKGKKKEELGVCPYCRTPMEISEEEAVERLKKLLENESSPNSFNIVAKYYENGSNGMPRDHQKANELYLKAGELGCANGYANLGYSYGVGRGAEIDKKKAKHYWELAAMRGDVEARRNLGVFESKADNHERADKHFVIAAKAGDKFSLDVVKKRFTKGFVTKEEYECTLRAYHESQIETKSKAREAVMAYL